MLTDFAAACADGDPVLVVPWAAAPEESGHGGLGRAFVDLREDAWALDGIPEAEQHPALLGALRALNAPRSPVWTAKCDVWPLDPDEADALRAELEDEESPVTAELAHGTGSYLDLLPRDRTVFASYHQVESWCHRLLRLAEPLDLPLAALRTVVRPAVVDFGTAQEGYSISLYTLALGYSAADGYSVWGEALGAATALIRSRELRGTPARGVR